MDEKTPKERLEQELRFLKESLEAEVIGKEEFEKGKERIEKKLKEIDSKEGNDGGKIDYSPEPIDGVQEKSDAGPAKADNSESLVIKEQNKIKLKVIRDESQEHSEERRPEVHEQESNANEPKEEKGKNRLFKYFLAFILVVAVLAFAYYLIDSNKPVAGETEREMDQAGQQTQKSQKINVIILNARKECFNCDTKRILDILTGWFGPISAAEVDYGSVKGQELSKSLNIKLLPAYILDSNITTTQSFEKYSKLFLKKGDLYMLADDAAASTFYLQREPIPNKLDLFVIGNDAASSKAEANLREFLENFKGVQFQIYHSNDSFTKDLGIKSFPTFLVNNRIRFSGIQPAETIKTNFCSINKIEGCEKELSKSLV
ncbi:hypothetical protein HYS31_01240 [Candidatus Woesearchaeota archaeon]|nr:hypothetical protein [Candidatus Woesearchaeota archaeon]